MFKKKIFKFILKFLTKTIILFILISFFSYKISLTKAQSATETRVVNVTAQVGELFNPAILGGGGGFLIDLIIPPIINIPEINEEELDIKDDKKPILCPIKADLNCDQEVNLIDFSILIFWFEKENFPRHVDIIRDNEINLRDFSSLAFYWNENN